MIKFHTGSSENEKLKRAHLANCRILHLPTTLQLQPLAKIVTNMYFLSRTGRTRGKHVMFG